MKIICIGRNYADHAREMNSPVPAEPVFFMKPDTAILKDDQPFYYPDFSNDVHYEAEIVLKINKAGKNIASEFAAKYFTEITVGIDFTARDLQEECKKKGLPWEKAKAFDGSAVLGQFINKPEELKNLSFGLELSGKMVQNGNTTDMIFSFEQIISYVSRFVTLKTGDLIFTGTPAGVGPVKIGDRLTGKIGNKVLLNFEIK